MPSKIPKVSGNEMIKYLIKNGYVVTHRKGSHVTLRNNELFTTIPAKNHKLGIGLLLKILSNITISREEFIEDYDSGIIK